MKLNQKLIEKLRNGEIAVANNGDRDSFNLIIREAAGFAPIGKWAKSVTVISDDLGEYAITSAPEGMLTLPTKDFFETELVEFKNGNEIEYRVSDYWLSGIYIGEFPCNDNYVVLNQDGVLCIREVIRHKTKKYTKEQLLERIEDQLLMAKDETNLSLRSDYIQQALIDLRKLNENT